jgi:hypothetical protein
MDIFERHRQREIIYMRILTWNVRSFSRAGSLKTVAKQVVSQQTIMHFSVEVRMLTIA